MSERDSRPLTILGIETSCDETAAAIVRREGEAQGIILSSIVRSQNEEHEAYGGVVPEIAARAHVEALDGVIDRARRQAGLDMADIDAIAATAGPGLIGGLIVGLMTAKAMAAALGKPLLAINHLEGHALTVRLTDGLDFPFLLLLVSGGHTQLLSVLGVGRYRRLGTTIDDALGEAYDKTAKLLGLAGPGGPAVEAMASSGDADRFALPRPLLGKESLDFSFSGLKSAVRRMAEATAPLEHRDIADLCAGFQAAILDILRDKVARAIDIQGQAPLVVAGGVAANRAIRCMLENLAAEKGVRFVAPPIDLCGDNAAMIAWAGAERLAMGENSAFDTPPRARWPLDEAATPRIGSGRKGGKA